jgi:hypothetical protein
MELVPPLAWATGHAWIYVCMYLTASIPAFVGRGFLFCARRGFHELGVAEGTGRPMRAIGLGRGGGGRWCVGMEAETGRGVGGGVARGNTDGYDGAVHTVWCVCLLYLRGGFVHRNTLMVGISE